MPSLPTWLTINDAGVFIVDPDIAYPLALAAMGVSEDDATQFDIECAYQCVKMKVQDIVTGTALDPRPDRGFVIIIEASGSRKDRWRLASFKPGTPGRDVNAATKGLKAKQLYNSGVGAQLA